MLEKKLKYKRKSIDGVHSRVAYYRKKSQQKQLELDEIKKKTVWPLWYNR